MTLYCKIKADKSTQSALRSFEKNVTADIFNQAFKVSLSVQKEGNSWRVYIGTSKLDAWGNNKVYQPVVNFKIHGEDGDQGDRVFFDGPGVNRFVSFDLKRHYDYLEGNMGPNGDPGPEGAYFPDDPGHPDNRGEPEGDPRADGMPPLDGQVHPDNL